MKVYLDSVGCRLNQSEIERMAQQLRAAGHELVGSPEQSELVIINTCTVTAAAAADSRNRARRAHHHNPHTRIVLTGCWNTLQPEAARELPGVVKVVPNDAKERLISDLLDIQPERLDQEPLERVPIPGNRMRTRAFIKVQDGCDHHCTYCLTTIARGPARSVPISRILRDIRAAIAGGVQEVVLTGVQLGAYGSDSADGLSLASVIRAILRETDIPRLRLSSLEPWCIREDFFQLWEDPRLCRQLHLPLQSGCGRTLRRMGRPIDPQTYTHLVARARQAIAGLAVTTDLMVGFPGESDDEFTESLEFIRGMQFAGAHVFPYSPRPGTPATRLPHPVSPHIAHEHSLRCREVTALSAQAFRTQFLGETMRVLWEGQRTSPSNGRSYTGLTDNYLRVFINSDRDIQNTLSSARMHALEENGIRGMWIDAA